MVYTDNAFKLLDVIIRGKYTIEDNVRDINEAFDKEFEVADTVVLCGALPFSEHFAKQVSRTKKVYYLDAGDGEGMYAGCPIVSVTDLGRLSRNCRVLYVIMSRSMIEFYMYIIRKMDSCARIAYYASAQMAHREWFDLPARGDYTPLGVSDSIRYIHDNADKIIQNLEMLNDMASREIYSRIILFRLTFDMNLNIDVKSDKTEYLDDDIINWNHNECVVDVGGYVGDTLYDFREYFLENNIEFEYYLLEPSAANCDEALKIADGGDNIHIIKCCAGDENKTVYLGSTMGSAITVNLSGDENGESTEMYRIDDLMNEKRVTYIKMDIEGSEEIALKGAVNTIAVNRPKLAICIYHKYDDVVRLMEYVKKLTADKAYDYYVRAQRESVVTEMVMYAIPR